MDISPFFYIGSIGVLTMTDYVPSPIIELPSINLLDKYSKIGLQLTLAEFYEQEEFIYKSLITKLYWTPPLFGNFMNDDFNILGPFLDLGFENDTYIKINFGAKFLLSISSDDIFDSFPSIIRIKGLDIEIGYSLFENYFFASIETDLLGVIIGISKIYLDNYATTIY